MKKVIVFDLYNTLIAIQSNTQFFYRLYQESSNGFGIDRLAYKHLLLTKPIQVIKEQLGKAFQELYTNKQSELTHELNSIVLFDESTSVLQELTKHHQLFLISNLAEPYAQAFYRLGLHTYFTEVFFSFEHGFIKPQTEIFQLVEKSTNTSGKNILMVGDSQRSDIEGAQKMGWESLRINRKSVELKNSEIGDLTELVHL